MMLPALPVSRRPLRFLAVGAINTAFGYGLFALLTFAELTYPIAIALATMGGIAFNYQSTGKLVFGDAAHRSIARFAATYVIVYLVNVAAIAVLLRVGPNVYFAQGLALLPNALLAYFLQRNYVFKSS